MTYRLAKRAEADLDEILYYITKASGRLASAERVIDSITERFSFIADNPFAGRARNDDLGRGRRSFPADHYVIVYRVRGRQVTILRVLHGSRDLNAMMGRRI